MTTYVDDVRPVIITPNPAASFEALFVKDSRHLRPVAPGDKARVYAMLDEIGADAILEHIASGFLPVELAVANKFPLLTLQDWLTERVEPERLVRAVSTCAEVFMVKAMLPLTVKPGSNAEAIVNTRLSEVMMKVAEKLDPTKWGNKVDKRTAGDGNMLVINVGGALSSDKGTITIEPVGEEPAATEQPAQALLRLVGGPA